MPEYCVWLEEQHASPYKSPLLGPLTLDGKEGPTPGAHLRGPPPTALRVTAKVLLNKGGEGEGASILPRCSNLSVLSVLGWQ